MTATAAAFRKTLGVPELSNEGMDTTVFNSDDVARLVGVTGRAIRKWAAAGRISSLRLPDGRRRYTQEDIDRFMASLREQQQ